MEKLIFVNTLKKYPAALKHKRVHREAAWKKVTKEYSDAVMFKYKTEYLKRQYRESKGFLKRKLNNLKYMFTENIENKLYNWEKELLLLNHNEVMVKSDEDRLDKFHPSIIDVFTNTGVNRIRTRGRPAKAIRTYGPSKKNVVPKENISENVSMDDEIKIEEESTIKIKEEYEEKPSIKLEEEGEEEEGEDEESSNDTNEFAKILTEFVKNQNMISARDRNNKNKSFDPATCTIAADVVVTSTTTTAAATITTTANTTTAIAAATTTCTISTDRPTPTACTDIITKDYNEIVNKNGFIKIFESKLIDNKLYIKNVFKEKDNPVNEKKEFSPLLSVWKEKIKNKAGPLAIVELSDDEKDDGVNINKEKDYCPPTSSNVAAALPEDTIPAKREVNNNNKNDRDKNNYEDEEIIVKLENINDFIVTCELENKDVGDHNYNKNVDVYNRNFESTKLNVGGGDTNVSKAVVAGGFISNRPFRQCRKRKMITDEFFTGLHNNIVNAGTGKKKRKRSNIAPNNNNNNIDSIKKINSVKSSKNVEKQFAYEERISVEPLPVVEEDDDEKVDEDNSSINNNGDDDVEKKSNLENGSKNIEKGLREDNNNDSVSSPTETDETSNNNKNYYCNGKSTGGVESRTIVPSNVLDIVKSYSATLENLSMEEIHKCLLIQQIQLNDMFIKNPTHHHV